MKDCRIFIISLVILLLVIFYMAPKCSALDETDASNAISKAERDLVLAYRAVAEAEVAGGNVSVFGDRLVYAGELLVNANNAFRVGDYENARLYALNCSNVVADVAYNASILRAEVDANYRNQLYQTVASSVTGISVLCILSIFLWTFLKRKYIKRVLELKPELGRDNE